MNVAGINLTRTKAIIQKELAWYFNNPGGFILIALFIGFSNFLFFRDFFVNNNATLRPYFLTAPWLLIFLTGGVSMRVFAEERRNGTFEVLLSLPLSEGEIVLGKFLASFIFVTLCFLGSFTLPITLIFLSQPDLGALIAGYLGISLFSAAFLSIGIFLSTLSRNQVVSLLTIILTLFFLVVLGDDFVLQQVPKAFVLPLSLIGFSPHLTNFSRGIVDLRDVIFFLTVIFGFNFLSIKIIENRD